MQKLNNPPPHFFYAASGMDKAKEAERDGLVKNHKAGAGALTQIIGPIAYQIFNYLLRENLAGQFFV